MTLGGSIPSLSLFTTDYCTGNYSNVLLKTGSCWYVNLTDVSVELHDNVNWF